MENNPDTIPTDGFRSRKFLVTAIGTGFIEVLAGLAFWCDKMNADQWASFQWWFWPLTLGVFSTANVWEKFAYRKPKE